LEHNKNKKEARKPKTLCICRTKKGWESRKPRKEEEEKNKDRKKEKEKAEGTAGYGER